MSTKFTCRFCKEQFDVPKGLYKHLQIAHNAGVSRDNRTCPICGVLCSKYDGYRDHLLYIHGQADDGQKLTFKSLNEFLVWKAELELKHNCKYVLQTSPKVLPTKEKKYFYQCDRSDSKTKDKKSLSVVMKTCSSVISVVEGTGVFKVEYWDTHSGHSEVASVQSVQNELEAAISSVEMVNAIADSDDSFDKSEELLLSDNSSPMSTTDKPTFFIKTHSPSNVNNFNNSSSANVSKTKTIQSSVKVEGPKKKSTSTSILYSLASVACGKGISKKIANKSNENKDIDSKGSTELNSKHACEKSNESSLSVPEEHKDDSSEVMSVSQATSVVPSLTTTTTTLSSSVPPTTKSSSGPPAIAPKITTVPSNSLNSLFTTNSAFPNQLVIVNPVGMDQNALNSNQNVFTAGQNILLSLGSLGQNIVPTNASPQSINPVASTGENTVATAKTKVSKAETVKNNASAKSSLTTPQSTSTSTTITSASASTVPVTLTSGLNNAPVILSSLPVGSTFMSVNNNLIPIATPTGTFLPSSLPPNIVLTPVMPGTNLPSIDSSLKTTFSSTNAISAPPPNIQTQMRYTTPSITVSSIVKEPVYTSTAIKHMSNIVTSTTSLVTSSPLKNSLKTYSKNRTQNKFVPIAISGKASPVKNANKFTTSTPIKPNLNSKMSKCSPISLPSKIEPNLFTNKSSVGKFRNNSSGNKVNSTLSSKSSVAIPAVSVSSVSVPKSGPSARKRITRNIGKSKLTADIVNKSAVSTMPIITSTVSTKVVNSQLNLAPISSTSDVTIASQQLDSHKPGTLLFESSGDVYMLEPVENDTAQNISPLRSISSLSTYKAKIDRSVQTNESISTSAYKSKLQRKRAAPPTDDSAVMLKVKCYQLEMKYLNIQTECKRLKVELTREKLKNAELLGEKLPSNMEVEAETDTPNKAVEIIKEIEDKFSENKEVNIYTMTKTSVLRSLYEDLEELCIENSDLHKELENYRAHDKFYKSLKKRLYEEEF